MPDWIGDQMAGVGPEATRGLRHSGHSQTVQRTGQVDPNHAFKVGLLDGREGRERGHRRYEYEASGATVRERGLSAMWTYMRRRNPHA
jgi:hypothetical protein